MTASSRPNPSFPFRLESLIAAVLIGLYGISSAWKPALRGFLHGVNFLFHEAGHLFFAPFGQFLHTLGGTLTELSIPALCCGYFFYKKQYFSAFAVLTWLAHVLFGVSVYAGDAAVTRLPLPENTYHDWNWMLARLGWLRYTTALSRLIYFCGLLSLAASIGGMLYHARATPDDPAFPPSGEPRDKIPRDGRFASRV